MGNPGWPTGPGHGALIADGNVHTFERVNMTSSNSGWVVMKTATYLGKQENTARPVVIQELNTSMVQTEKVMAYMDTSTRADEDFVSSGWCSLQSAAALAEGIASGFDPAGLNTPRAVYERAKALKL